MAMSISAHIRLKNGTVALASVSLTDLLREWCRFYESEEFDSVQLVDSNTHEIVYDHNEILKFKRQGKHT